MNKTPAMRGRLKRDVARGLQKGIVHKRLPWLLSMEITQARKIHKIP